MTTPTPEALARAEVVLRALDKHLFCRVAGAGNTRQQAAEVIALALTEQDGEIESLKIDLQHQCEANARNFARITSLNERERATWEAMREFVEQKMALDPEHPTIGPLFDIGWENAREVMVSQCRARAAAQGGTE